jgi:hypothetical protein
MLSSIGLSSMAGCFPREDLSDYSGAGNPPGPDASTSAGGASGSGGSAGSSGDGGSAAASGSGGADLDASVPPADAALSSDAEAGAFDAGDAEASLAEACADLGGVLEPGTRDCFLITGPPLLPLSWPAASGACGQWGGTLATIESQATDAFLTARTTADVWIGARDPAAVDPASNAFAWLVSENLVDDGYDNWGLMEPDATADQFCVEKRNDGLSDPWFDQPCAEIRAFVCEQAL